MLTKYFESKIGSLLKKSIVTGDDSFVAVYERVYKFEIIGVQNEKLFLAIESYDKSPSGMLKGQSENYFGEHEVELSEFVSRDKILDHLIEKVDKPFLDKYKAKADRFAAKQKQRI